MKKTIVKIMMASILSLSLTPNLSAKEELNHLKLTQKFESVKWNHLNKKTLYEGDRPVFLIVGGSTCHFCKILKDNISNSDVLRNILMNNFTTIYVEQDLSYCPDELQSKMTPTIHFLDKDGKQPLIKKVVGDPGIDYLVKASLFILKQYSLMK